MATEMRDVTNETMQMLAKQAQIREEKNDRIVNTYVECTKMLNELFGLLYDEVCKPCVERTAGQGCCHYGPCSEEVYNSKIIEAREQIRKKAIADGKKIGFCNYHVSDEGCIIPDFKSPKCAAQWCPSDEVEEKYGIKYDNRRVEGDLELILVDARLENGAWKYDGSDSQAVSDLKSYIQSMIDSVKKVKSASVTL